MSRGRKKPNLHDWRKEIPDSEQFLAYVHELAGENDRASALVACSFLEVILQGAIKSKFIQLIEKDENLIFTGPGAPLSGLFAKTQVAYALGIISEETRGFIDRIRNIRNVFAHRFAPTSFSDDAIACECNKFPELSFGMMMMDKVENQAKRRYLAAHTEVIFRIANYQHLEKKKKDGNRPLRASLP